MSRESLNRRRAWVVAVGAGILAGLLLAPWWRNHAMLRDFYDYGLVMAAVGRMEAGERPYVDFLTPIQTLHFLISYAAEGIWGARYLSLTYANAVASVAALAGFALVLMRRLGAGLALIVAATVVVGSFGQHTIIWHNSLGVTWLAVASWCAARLSAGSSRRAWWVAVMFAALWLGGMTKVTYQVASLAFVMLFIGRSVLRGAVARGAGVWIGAGVVVFGIVAPILTEMAYTGASFATWKANVFELAASRKGLLLRVLTPEFYWRTPHDYYAGANFPFVGGWGVLLVAALSWRLWRAARAKKEARGEVLFLAVAAVGALVCGVVLLATNFEIAHVSGAAWLVLATGLVLAFAREREGRWILAVGAVTLGVPAWWSAWTGARVLWGREALVRERFVTTEELPPRYAYLEGILIESGMRDSLMGFDDYANGRRERGIYFAHGTEWMVRVAPGARHPGLPLWLHDGTTYSDENAWIINARLAHREIESVVALEPWNHWHFGAAEILRKGWSGPRRVGPHLMVYEPQALPDRPLSRPVEFAMETESNVDARRMSVAGAAPFLQLRKDGVYLAQQRGSVVTLDDALANLRGEMVAELIEPVTSPVAVTFRVAESAERGRVLSEQRVWLSNEMSSWNGRFDVDAGGRAISLTVDMESGKIGAGWRKLRTHGAVTDGEEMPGPLDVNLKALSVRSGWADALLTETDASLVKLAGFGIDAAPDMRNGARELFVHAPGEIWFRASDGARRVTGEGGLREHAWIHADSLPGVIMRVVFCRGSRLEVLFEKELRPQTREEDRLPQRFEVTLPENGGWIALTMVSTQPSTHAWGHGWWRNVRVE